MMKKQWIAAALAGLVLASCVPQRKYQDLETRYMELEGKKKQCDTELNQTVQELDSVKRESIGMQEHIRRLVADSTEVHTLFESNKKLYGELKDSYEKLLKNNKLAEEKLLESLKELENKLMAKEKALAEKEAGLNENIEKNEKLKADLEVIRQDLVSQQQKVKELQSILDTKDSVVKALRNKISDALLGFKDKGLSVEIRNGKVYVSLEEKLLFASGSIVVDNKGKEALLQLASSIREMKDINIMVEGHTDDVPMSSGQIMDYWELCVL